MEELSGLSLCGSGDGASVPFTVTEAVAVVVDTVGGVCVAAVVVVELVFDCTVVVTGDVVVGPVGTAVASELDEFESLLVEFVTVAIVVVVSVSVMFDVTFVPGVVVSVELSGDAIVVFPPVSVALSGDAVVVFPPVSVELSEDAVVVVSPVSVELTVVVVSSSITVVVIVVVIVVAVVELVSEVALLD